MIRHNVSRSKFCVSVVIAAVALTSFGAGAIQASPDDKFKDHPGYVDFEALGGFKDMSASVEVYLKGSLLVIAREALRHDEPELANILDKIHLVRVNVFELELDQEEALAKKTEELASKMEKKGWEIAVRVREEDENVYVYTLPGDDDMINGLVVMVIETEGRGRHADNEFTFVNIVGSINPEDVGRLSRVMDIHGVDLDDIYDSDRRHRRKWKD